ncbi:MAG TPA: hypothetical protein VF619_05840 [Allosphingosinicella sp.]|jgi:anaerobic selenocysteine-containing dehydrogenase
MRSTPLIGILAATALATSAAAEPGSPGTRSAAESSAKSDDDKVICRYEAVTGQLAGRVKRCLTGKQWRARSRNARADGEKMLGKGFTCGNETRACD